MSALPCYLVLKTLVASSLQSSCPLLPCNFLPAHLMNQNRPLCSGFLLFPLHEPFRPFIICFAAISLGLPLTILRCLMYEDYIYRACFISAAVLYPPWTPFPAVAFPSCPHIPNRQRLYGSLLFCSPCLAILFSMVSSQFVRVFLTVRWRYFYGISPLLLYINLRTESNYVHPPK